MVLTVRLGDIFLRVDHHADTTQLRDVHRMLVDVVDAWAAAPDQTVALVHDEDPDFAIRAVGLLWAKRIRPTILQMRGVVIDTDSLACLRQLESTAGYLFVLNKPIDTPAPPRIVDLLKAAPPVAIETQKTWTENWGRSLARSIAHNETSKLGAMRFLRGARTEGFMNDEEFATAAGQLNARQLIGVLHPAREAPADAAYAGQRILLSEDQLYWESLIRPVLRRDGFELTVRTTIRQTLQLLEQGGTEFSALILDLHYDLEESDPREIVRHIVAVAPQLPIVVFTSDIDGRLLTALAEDVSGFFFKEYEKKGSGNPAGCIAKFRERIHEAVAAGGLQAARACCRTINAPIELLSLLTSQAANLETPASALSLNVGLKALGLGPHTWSSSIRTHLRNYGAHLEGLPPPTLYESLASHLVWLEAAADGQAQSNGLREKVVATLRGFARARRDPFLDRVADVVLSDPDARERAVHALKSAVSAPGYALLIASVPDPMDLGPHLKAMERAFSVNRPLSPIDTGAQCLLLARLEIVCR